MRLDKFLAEQNKAVSRSRIQKAIKNGQVFVNGQKVLEPDFQISETDKIELPEFEGDELKPFDSPLKVVFENDDLAVIDKPAGLVVHPGAGNPEETLANILISKYPDIKNVGDAHRPGIVHRLDEDTSGLILVAKNQKALEYYKQQFKDRKIEKEYLALVEDQPPHRHGIIDAPLEKVPLKQKMSVRDGSAIGGKVKQAITEYWVLSSSSRNPDESQDLSDRDPESSSGLRKAAMPLNSTNIAPLQFSLLRVKLHTGRTHQIRAHLSHIGHPIVGDSVYGKPSELLARQFLHAYKLKFQLMDGTWLELMSELPEDLTQVLNKLKINYGLTH